MQLVYAAQPREGTETSQECHKVLHLKAHGVYAAQPREGTETVVLVGLEKKRVLNRFMQLNPARGRKLYRHRHKQNQYDQGLCSSTPRGDGNLMAKSTIAGAHCFRVYAAQPREGTETLNLYSILNSYRPWFMQLNPARGRKLDKIASICI